jgi:hypothetical protein
VEAGQGDADGALAGTFFVHLIAGGGEEFSLLLTLLLLVEKFFYTSCLLTQIRVKIFNNPPII